MTSQPRNPYHFSREEYNALVANLPRPQLSQRSDYEEIELIEDCTLYDIYRQPRAPINDPTCTKSISLRQLNADLTCPVCLCILRNTMVVMECLHRFCGECIQKCLRQANKECPSCRIHIPSKRSLRKDENFDELIHQIHPNIDEFEEKENKVIAELNRKRHFNNAFTQSMQKGAQNQAIHRRQGKRKSPPSSTSDRTHGQDSSSNSGNSGNSEASSAANSPTNDASSRKKSKPEASTATLSTITTATTTTSAGVAAPAAPNATRSASLSTTSANSTTNKTATMPSTSSAATPGPAAPVSATATPTPATTPANKTVTTSNTATTANSNGTAASAKPTTAAGAANAAEEKVNLRVNLHPLDKASPKLERTLFRTSPKLKVRHLKRHLLGLLHEKDASLELDQMRVVLVASNCTLSGLTAKCLKTNQPVRKELLYDQELEDHWTLRDLYDQFGMGLGWEIQLQYHFAATIENPMAKFIQESTNFTVQ